MDYYTQLHFFQQLLKGMHISSCIIENPEDRIPPEIDLGLRAGLFNLDNYTPFLQNSMREAKDNTVYRFYDEYDCNYIFLRLPDKTDTYFYIGPYLLSIPEKKDVENKIQQLGLHSDQVHRMERYYSELPLIEDENLLLNMTNTLANFLWGSPEQYSMEYVDYAIPDRYEPISISQINYQIIDNTLSLSTLEHNYNDENQLINAVSKGKLHLVTAITSAVSHSGTQSRQTDSLRGRKNDLIILKTLLRKAAEYGGVHPLHIHHLSSHYAYQIEHVHTIKESMVLQEDMIRNFCQLVKQHSLSKYSYYVGQAITLVQYDLTADLSLKAIAEKLNVNASYLSTLFHKEYGCTLTEFVNNQRIERAIALLKITSKSVQEIATDCGIHDTNYFIKLFKKQTGTTPHKFRDRSKTV